MKNQVERARAIYVELVSNGDISLNVAEARLSSLQVKIHLAN